jgi:hypothetical protein
MPRWTSEARQRQAELIENWRPWEQSTRPTTKEGKVTSSQNSLKTGWHSAEMRELRAFLTQLDRERRELIERYL